MLVLSVRQTLAQAITQGRVFGSPISARRK
jgi:hypothetical protein